MQLQPNPTRSNPSNPTQTVGQVSEHLVAQWTEPERNQTNLNKKVPVLSLLGLCLVLGLLIFLGIRSNRTYFLTVAVLITAGFAVVMQRKVPSPRLVITLTNLRIVIGRKSFLLSDLAGFWLEETDGQILVNLEPKKAAITPVNFLYPEGTKEEARQTLLRIIPEVEPRQKNISDWLNQYWRV